VRFQQSVEDFEVSQRILDEQIQASRVAFKTTLKTISDKYKTLRENVQEENGEGDEPRDGEETERFVEPLPLKPLEPPNSSSPEFENGKNGNPYFPAPSPTVLPPSQAQGMLRKSTEMILAKPPASKPPPKPPDLRSLPATVSAPSPATCPPFNMSDDNSARTPPPENIAPLLLVSPPPQPPDLLFLPDTVLVPPPTPRQPPQSPLKSPPNPKPPDLKMFRESLQNKMKFFQNHQSVPPSLPFGSQKYSKPLDPSIVALEKSQPCAESTVHVKLYCPIMYQHVALHISNILSTHSQLAFPHTVAFPRTHQVTFAAPIHLSPSAGPLASKNSTSTTNTIEALVVIPNFHAQNMCLPGTRMNSKFTSYYYVPSTNFNAWATNSTYEIVGLLMGHDKLSLFISQRHINGQWKQGVQSTTRFLPFKQWDPGKKNYSILIIILQP
jgi:hypothetical protein